MTLRTICTSHSPCMGLLSAGEGVEEAVRVCNARLAEEIREYAPDLLVIFAPDHFNGFFYDVLPQFCVGVRAVSIGDYATESGPLDVPEDRASALAEALVAAQFDTAVSYKMQVDHAVAQPLVSLTGALDRYPTIPIFINSAGEPRASFGRARLFGEAVGRHLLESGLRVLIIGSGGLSHDTGAPTIATADEVAEQFLIEGRNPSVEARQARQASTLRAAREFASGGSSLHPINADWDRHVLDLFAKGDLDAFDAFEDAQVTMDAGASAQEVRTWVAAFAAQAAAGSYRSELLYNRSIPEWLVGMAIVSASPCE